MTSKVKPSELLSKTIEKLLYGAGATDGLLTIFLRLGAWFIQNRPKWNIMSKYARYAHLPQTPAYSPLRAFSMAIDTANQLGADFAMMGGDMVFDVLRGQAHSEPSMLKNAAPCL